jgi:hypothetical protein
MNKSTVQTLKVYSSVVDSGSDPSSIQEKPDTDVDPGFDDQKLKKKMQLKYFFVFLLKIALYLTLSLLKGRPSYRRSVKPS